MKTLKTLFSVLVLAAVFSVNAFAQAEDTQEITATATVFSTLSMDFTGGSASIDFGGLLQGAYTATVQSDGSAHTNAGESASPASGVITADAGSVIFISYENGVMANDDSDLLTVTPTVHVDGNAIAAAGGTYAMTAATAPIVIGGSVDILPATPTGEYSTTKDGGENIVITFNYN